MLFGRPPLTRLLFSRICGDPNLPNKVDLTHDEQYGSRPCGAYVNKVAAVADQWSPYDYNLQYCVSERVAGRCSYSGNVPIVAVVLVCNAIKLAVMMFVATRLRDNPLITVGDAVESFLNENDKTTQELCLITKNDVIRAVRSSKHWRVHDQDKYGSAGGKLARRKRKLWATAAGGRRWSLTVGFILLAVIISSILLSLAIAAIHRNGYKFLDVGFGEIDPAAIITGWSVGVDGSASTKILASILIANLPQTILSFLYLNLNGLLTRWVPLSSRLFHFWTEFFPFLSASTMVQANGNPL